MTTRHTLLFRLVGPMQAWGYRSRFEDRDTGLEPTRSGVFGLLASACGIERSDTQTLAHWDEKLRFGIRVDIPKVYNRLEKSGFRVETDFHTAQDVLRATGKGTADTVLSRRHYLTDARYTVGLESDDLELLNRLESGLKNPVWTLCLGRKSFPLSLPPWLPGGGVRERTMLFDALQKAPFTCLGTREGLPDSVSFAIELNSESKEETNFVNLRLADRPLDFQFDKRKFGLRDVAHFRRKTADCGMEADRCIFQS